jgi:hypothetical protein
MQSVSGSRCDVRLLSGDIGVQHPRGSGRGHRYRGSQGCCDCRYTEGNWRLGVFIDDEASDEQFEKLVQVFSGQLGGPMAALGPLVGEMLGVERASIQVSDDGLRHSVRVGDVIDFEIEDIVPFGVETGEPVRFSGMFHPVGSDLTMAEARRSRINAFGIEYEGKTGLSKSEFSWAA